MRFLLFTALATSIAFASCKEEVTETPVTVDTEETKFSYSIGIDIAQNFKKSQLDTLLDQKAFFKGIKDGLDTTGEYLISPQEAQALLQDFFRKKQEEAQQARLLQFEGNKQAGIEFLEENKSKEGVKVTESGLQYKIVRYGWGAKPTEENVVKVNYTGKLIDGTIFDTSVKDGKSKPISFPVTGVIKGWTEALKLMRVGAKWELYIPYNLAYGEAQPSQLIKPYSALIFEVELLKIEK